MPEVFRLLLTGGHAALKSACDTPVIALCALCKAALSDMAVACRCAGHLRRKDGGGAFEGL